MPELSRRIALLTGFLAQAVGNRRTLFALNPLDQQGVYNRMTEIPRSLGSTESERLLAALAEKSFLDLWSYANVYRDQGIGSVGVGSELCDLMVVCGDHVVLFSDKSIVLTPHQSVHTAWKRWYRRAIKKSADQLLGAERWLDHPNRLFLDPKCLIPFPIDIPPKSTRKVHLVVVAGGAARACQNFFGGGSGSLMFVPHLTADVILDSGETDCLPFQVGDVYPGRPFVHVLDEATLGIVLSELDTITDFVKYLQKKEEFIRAGRLICAAGEEDLVAYYVKRMNEDKEHDFTAPAGGKWNDLDGIMIDEGEWESTVSNPQYIAKKQADEISYLWDDLVSAFTVHLLAGTSLVPGSDFRVPEGGGNLDVRTHELAVRQMALENRFRRRMLGSHIWEAINAAKPDLRKATIVADAPGEGDAGYVFLQVPRDVSLGYEEYDKYRQARNFFLYVYCSVLKARHKHLRRVIGIATEPPKYAAHQTTSEDLLFLEGEWTQEAAEEAERLSAELQILRTETTRSGTFSASEYPDTPPDDPTTSD